MGKVIEFVLAPDPNDLSTPWTSVFYGIDAARKQKAMENGEVFTPICTPDTYPSHVNAGSVVTLQAGETVLKDPPLSCDEIDF